MTMRQDFGDLLKADSDISGEVGSRVYFRRLPQGTSYPAATYQVIDGPRREGSLDGGSRIYQTRMQVDAWARTALEAETLANHIRDLLDGNQTTQGGTRFAAMTLTSMTDLYEESVEAYRITADYDLSHWST